MNDKMQLAWSPKSPYVRKVMVVAIETGAIESIEQVRTVATVSRPNPVLMRDNPLSKVPTLRLADGTVLFDSAVICEYLDELTGAGLFPRGSARWPALRWHALGNGMLDTVVPWRHERERAEAARSLQLLDAYRVKTESALRALDGEVEALRAAPFSIGHIAVGCALGYLDFRMPDLPWRTLAPSLALWFADVVMSRPSFQATVPEL